MKSTDELFALIQSMDKNEKGYFRKFSKLHGSNREGNYLKLFDTMASMADYSDKKLREKVKGKQFASQLSATKFYLKKMIVRALRNYYEDRLPQLQRVLSIGDTQVMMHKKMNESLPLRFEKELATALTGARWNEYKFVSALYHEWLGVYGSPKKFEGVRTNLLVQDIEVLKQQLNLNEYLLLHARVSAMNVQGGVNPTPALQDEMRGMLKHPLLTDPQQALTDNANEIRLSTLVLLYHLTGQAGKVIGILRSKIEYADKNISIKSSPFIYIQNLNSLLNMLRRKDLDEMWEVLKKFEEGIQAHKDIIGASTRWNMEFSLLLHQARYYLYKREGSMVLLLVKKMKQMMNGNPSFMVHHEFMVLSIEALALVEMKQFDKAVDIVNRIYNENYKIRTDLTLIATRLSIIIHIEWGNFELVETLVKRAAKLSKTVTREQSYQRELYSYLKGIAGKFRSKKQNEISITAKKFLQFLDAKEPDELDYLRYWLQDIIAGSRQAG